jgi:uracil-DNA glycosylase family protein
VFGEGPTDAEIMFVGEQPGDQEDLQGHPFVGPAGRVFDQAAARAGIDRSRTYVTNAVKHFKFVPRGKRRLHQKANAGEVAACKFWLNLELAFVKPRIVVALGATAATSLLGRPVTISSVRGKPIEMEDGSILYVTVHPSYLLRIRDRDEARTASRAFDMDLRKVRELAEAMPRERRLVS